jgi:hypothetical protein
MRNPRDVEYFAMMGKKKDKPKSEDEIHAMVAKYIKNEYPDLFFVTDLMGEYFTEGQRNKINVKRCLMKVPDLLILEPNGIWAGLVMELKKDAAHPLRKDGVLKKDEHLEEQAKSLLHLRARGYHADFFVGYQDSVNSIDAYMNRNFEYLNARQILK